MTGLDLVREREPDSGAPQFITNINVAMKLAGVGPEDVIDGEIVASPGSTEASDGDLSSWEQLAGPEGPADGR